MSNKINNFIIYIGLIVCVYFVIKDGYWLFERSGLKDKGIQTEALITNKYYKSKYYIVGQFISNDSISNEVVFQISIKDWKTIDKNSNVKIIYDPKNPNIATLVKGGLRKRTKMFTLTIFGVLSVVFTLVLLINPEGKRSQKIINFIFIKNKNDLVN